LTAWYLYFLLTENMMLQCY